MCHKSWYISFMDTYCKAWMRQIVILLLFVVAANSAQADNLLPTLDADYRFTPEKQSQSAWQKSDQQKLWQLRIDSSLGVVDSNWRRLDLSAQAIQTAVSFDYHDAELGVRSTASFEQLYSPDLIKKQSQEIRVGLDAFDWGQDQISSILYLVASRAVDSKKGFTLYPGLQFIGSEFTTELDIDLSGDTMMYFKYRW